MKILFKIFFFLLIFNNIIAQNNSIDSLKKVINSTTSDTTKVNTLNKFAEQMIRYNLSSSFDSIELSILIANQTSYELGLAKALKIKAILFYYTGEIDSSFILLDESLNIYLEHEDLLNAGRVYNNIGILLKNQGDINNSIEKYLTAINLFIQVKEKRDLIAAYINLSNAYRYQGNYQRALSVNFDALSILDQIDNKKYSDSLKIGHIYKTIANIYSVQKKYDQADSNYNIALDIYRILNSSQDIADIYVNFGTNAEEKNDYIKIINFNRRAINLYTSASKIAVADINIANSYIDLMNFDSAKIFIDDALEIYQQPVNDRGLALVEYSYGRYYFFQNKHNEAIDNLIKSLEYASVNNDYEFISKVTKVLYQAYKNVGNFEKALEIHEQYKSAEDSIFNKNNEQQLTEMALTYDFEKEKQQTELVHLAEIKRQKIVRNFSLIILLIAILGLISLFSALRTKKRKNEELRLKNNEIMQQKEEIISQNEEIEAQKREIELQRDLAVDRGNELQQKNNDIEASIQYAQRIQRAILPNKFLLSDFYKDWFVYYKPRDIVSGDFYWFFAKQNKIFVVAADCTGHGVPGAFMSMLGVSFFNQIVTQNDEISSDNMLNILREMVIKLLKQDVNDYEGSHDGMDLSLIIFDKVTKIVEFSGAYNSLYIISDNEPLNLENVNSRIFELPDNDKKIYELKVDRMPIGVFMTEQKQFQKYTVQLLDGDKIYMFSDGYPDLYSREQNKKFTTQRFKELLLSSANLDMKNQLNLIEDNYNNWVGKEKQIDDILIIGLQI
ncbi:MAG: tetratricopeptide repeat protein [Bacteroidales bacterium]|nr:tetratricopeptide repeat protein [Bacteroidales bacterium]